MNYVGIERNSMLNGDGLRTVLWTAGCSHNCKGCHNPSTHDPKAGKAFDLNAMNELIEALKDPYCAGLTLSGGDPLFCGNRQKVTEIAKEIKTMFPEKTIWCYTGYEFEVINDLEITNYVDVFVVGKFVEELKEENFQWAGSTNQRVMRKNEDGTFFNDSRIANELIDNNPKMSCCA